MEPCLCGVHPTREDSLRRIACSAQSPEPSSASLSPQSCGSEKRVRSCGTGAAPASALPHHLQSLSSASSCPLGREREGGWETWKKAVESGGGGGVEKLEVGMMVEFRV